MQPITAQEYIVRRQRLATVMDAGSVLILAGNGEIERTRDVAYTFRQSNNFWYLTGIDIPDALLVMHKTLSGDIQESLYVKELHPFMAVWEGRSNQLGDLSLQSGLANIKEYKQLDEVIIDLAPVVYIDMPDEHNIQPAAWQLWDAIKQKAPDTELSAINDMIADLRAVKSPQEIKLITAAIKEVDEALQAIRPMLKPGVTELQIAAELVRYSACRGINQAWPPIVSFGKNSCIIHHTPDSTKLSSGDLVLFDLGVEVQNYTSDVSRTVLIGEGSARQRQVIEAVKNVQSQAIKLIKPGVKFDEYEQQCGQIMAAALVDLGLFESIESANQPQGELQWPAYRQYFSHMTSHFLGLDGHDVGARDTEFVPGMVLTCEPGIYIAEESIGVRIEDDILITAEGSQNLSADVVLDI